jgi:hypothetical protein
VGREERAGMGLGLDMGIAEGIEEDTSLRVCMETREGDCLLCDWRRDLCLL